MSRGLGRIERAVLEIVLSPEFAAPEPTPWGPVEGVPIELLALYVAKGPHAAGLQHLPTRAEYMEAWHQSRGVGTSKTEVLPRSVIVSTRRAVSHLRKLGLVECRYSLPMSVTRPSTDEEKAERKAGLADAMAALQMVRR